MRRYGYSSKGKQCIASHDWHGKNVVQAIGALLNGLLLCVGLVSGTVNGIVFKAWLEQVLIPALPSNAIVVMDNASFHKVDGIRAILEKHGHRLLYLPPYSPDLNPIEQKWAQVKSLRNKLRTNDIDALFREHLL